MRLELTLVVRQRQAETAQQVCDWMHLLRVIRVVSPVSIQIRIAMVLRIVF